jgi:RNA polymerase sigma-70 factor (ECF subfamily)
VTVDERECLAERFEENRTRLRAVAYRMLGSLSEADDAVQESWLRLSRTDTSGVENLGGWLTTVVARVCLDMLRSRTSRREEPLGGHVPDPIVGRGDGFDPEHEVLLADRGTAAREPGTAPAARSPNGSRRRSQPPARSRQRLSCGLARR